MQIANNMLNSLPQDIVDHCILPFLDTDTLYHLMPEERFVNLLFERCSVDPYELVATCIKQNDMMIIDIHEKYTLSLERCYEVAWDLGADAVIWLFKMFGGESEMYKTMKSEINPKVFIDVLRSDIGWALWMKYRLRHIIYRFPKLEDEQLIAIKDTAFTCYKYGYIDLLECIFHRKLLSSDEEKQILAKCIDAKICINDLLSVMKPRRKIRYLEYLSGIQKLPEYAVEYCIKSLEPQPERIFKLKRPYASDQLYEYRILSMNSTNFEYEDHYPDFDPEFPIF